MTSHRHHRCDHCRVVYSFQASGHGCGRATNDPHYCPDCKKVVIEALKVVPPKVERVWVAVEDVDLSTVLEWEREHRRRCEEEGKIFVRRISAPLFDLEGNRTQRTGIVYHGGRIFQYRYWEGEEGDVEITEEMARDIETGRTEPWRSYQ